LISQWRGVQKKVKLPSGVDPFWRKHGGTYFMTGKGLRKSYKKRTLKSGLRVFKKGKTIKIFQVGGRRFQKGTI